MTQQNVKYRSLKGRSAGFASVTQLWMADDHLLSVTSVMGFESYRRFFFRDIEALIVVPTNRRLIGTVVLALVIAFIVGLGALFWGISRDPGSKDVSLTVTTTIAAPFLIGLVVNFLFGPTCSLWAQIGGRLEPLEAPVRLREIRRVIEVVSPKIEQTQAAASFAVS